MGLITHGLLTALRSRRWQVSHLSVTGMQPGVELPTLRLPVELRASRRLAATRKRLYGSQLLLMPHVTTATVDDLAAAAHRFGGKETRFPEDG